MRTGYLVGLLCWAVALSAVSEMRNIAPEALVTAGDRLNEEYAGTYAADGRIPDAGSQNDAGAAWCVPADRAKEVTLYYTWAEPRTIAALVYYGRTAWLWNENFLAMDICTGADNVLLKQAVLRRGHGPQLIHLETPVVSDRLMLRFSKPDSGPNPGASEIQLWTKAPDPTTLGKFTAAPGEPIAFEESKRLLSRVIAGELGFRELLVIERHEMNPSHVYTYHNEDFKPGGGLFRYSPSDGLKSLLDSPEGQLLDMELSYNGQEILFSWRRNASEMYQVFCINIDGTGLTQLTEGNHYNFNACWLPDGDIGFLSTRESAYAYCWNSPVGVLHRMDRNGKNVIRLSANYLNDFTPAVLEDGRVIYSRWEYVDRPAIPIQSLWTLHPDGTGLKVFFGNRTLSPATFMEARSIPGTDQVLCLLTAHNGPCRGAIGILDPKKGVNAQEAIRNLTPEVDIGAVNGGDGNHIRGVYENPFPLNDEWFLVSRKGTIVVRNYEGTEWTTLLPARKEMGFYNPKPIRAVAPPKLLPDARRAQALQKEQQSAVVYLQDIYVGLEPLVKRGEVARLRVVEELAKPVEISPQLRAFGFQFPVVSSGATYAPKKVWGETPVMPDGSACFEAPAGKPIYFMALDKFGRAVQRMRSFTHFMPGESQSCMGCHENRTTAPALNAMPEAFRMPPRKLDPPEWGGIGFSYPHIIQPILDQHCVSCHHAHDASGGVDLSGDFTDFFNVSYETLARMGTPAEDAALGGARQEQFNNPYTCWISTYNGSESNILEVEPLRWGSPASPLAELILAGHPDTENVPRVHLSDAEQRRLFAWIDLNVPYYGSSDSNYRDRRGCRDMKPDHFEPVFKEVALRRCVSCHGMNNEGNVTVPRKWYLRISEPEKNSFLLAPLAKNAGGTEACGTAVFASRDDADYQTILQTFHPIHAMLAQNPRLDMQ